MSAASKRDWCPYNQKFEAGEITHEGLPDLRYGLRGMTITCGASVYPPFSVLKDGEWSGYDIDLFRAVAEMGGFDVVITTLPDPQANETYDDILYGPGRNYDVLCTYWGTTFKRKSRGIRFSVPTTDISLILGAAVPSLVDPPFSLFSGSFFSFMRPFSLGLWYMLLGSIVFTAVYISWMEPGIDIGPDTDLERDAYSSSMGGYFKSLGRTLYQSWCLLTIQENFRPASPWTRLYLASWSAVILVLVAGYTAQLTTFLIVERQAISTINTVDDLIQTNQPACVAQGVPFETEFLRQNYPALQLTPLADISTSFEAARAGRCAGLVQSVASLELAIAENKQCDFRIKGRMLNSLYGAFPAHTSNCGFYPIDVIDSILQLLRERGRRDEIWDSYALPPATCLNSGSSGTVRSTDDLALNISTVGGIFILHAFVAVIALVGHVMTRVRRSIIDQRNGKADDQRVIPFKSSPV